MSRVVDDDGTRRNDEGAEEGHCLAEREELDESIDGDDGNKPSEKGGNLRPPGGVGPPQNPLAHEQAKEWCGVDHVNGLAKTNSGRNGDPGIVEPEFVSGKAAPPRPCSEGNN